MSMHGYDAPSSSRNLFGTRASLDIAFRGPSSEVFEKSKIKRYNILYDSYGTWLPLQ
ncbi:hypothetical protein E2C01_049193 [Portunus trituberculatus]|uniref:Uncharacterized protein n=1 Tax=Portunus trituberculatus TaxID=210409 RepID=A0A5B7G5I8_PORTR|nr:hypothetical protein [Portunus trituberculatus]